MIILLRAHRTTKMLVKFCFEFQVIAVSDEVYSVFCCTRQSGEAECFFDKLRKKSTGATVFATPCSVQYNKTSDDPGHYNISKNEDKMQIINENTTDVETEEKQAA